MTEPTPSPDPFSLLAAPLQRAIWDMGWPALRSIQQKAILAWNDPARPDQLIMAQTAGGKTEAAFLPVLSHVAHEPDGSVRAIYVGPLKALINDQFQRVELLCRHMDLPVHRWHGDVSDNAKRALVENPAGVLLITPESLESLMVNRTSALPRLLGGLQAVVIDELHAFLENERGLHLASLLTRVDAIAAERPRRIGLSATIGEPIAAARYLRPDQPEQVRIIEAKGEQKELLLRVHWYGRAESPRDHQGPDHSQRARTSIPPSLHAEGVGHSSPTAFDGAGPSGPLQPADHPHQPGDDDWWVHAMATDFVRLFHDSTNLVFCNSKGDIELLADAANALCRERGLDPRFHVHHGSLARSLREDAEEQMKDPAPDTAICSSTLEMGIDIGSVRTVGQVGPPWSVASLKQRVGRSGRKDGQSRRLRLFLRDDADHSAEHPERRLPIALLRTVAVLDLMITDAWVEPASPPTLDLSTLTHQIISTIAQTGGLRAQDMHNRLCILGPFRAVTPTLFARVLRSLGFRDVIEQAPAGDLILGLVGERLRSERDFYAAFSTPQEFTVRAGDTLIGTLPIVSIPTPGDHLILAARRWEIEDADLKRLEVLVRPTRGAKRPLFSGSPGTIHPRVAQKMLDLLRPATDATTDARSPNPPSPSESPADADRPGIITSRDTTTRDPRPSPPSPTLTRHAPAYLDPGSAASLESARALAARDALNQRRILDIGPGSSVCLAWAGTRALTTLVAALTSRGITSRSRDVSVACDAPADRVRAALLDFVRAAPPDAPAQSAAALALARHVQPKATRKFDHLLDDDLLDESIAADRLDLPGATHIARQIVQTS